MNDAWLFVGDAFVIVGTLALTLAVAGIFRIPNANAKIHAASKAVVLGALVILGGSVATGALDVMVRAALVGLFLLITSATGSHALAKLVATLNSQENEDQSRITSK